MISKVKRILSDFGLRISASAINAIANQIVLLPILSAVFPNAVYGMILTVIGVKNVITMSFGNSLNSTRLIMEAEYQKENMTGDFNFLMIRFAIVSVLVIFVYSFFNKEIDVLTLLFLLPVVFLYTINSYCIVWYTIKLKFKLALIQSIFVSIGTMIGALVVKLTSCWPLAYLCTAIVEFLFLYFRTDVFKESFSRTKLFRVTLNKWSILFLTTLLASLVTYLDRLLLNPLLGAEFVAVYYTSTYFGKALSLIAMPIASVILGYYAQRNFKFNLKRFWTINVACFVLLGLFVVLSLFVGEIVTGWLFPKLVEQSVPYILIGNLSAALVAVTNILQAAALKYAKTYFQIVIQIVYMIVYFTSGILCAKMYGLIGFCVASLIANILRLIMLLIISHNSIKQL